MLRLDPKNGLLKLNRYALWCITECFLHNLLKGDLLTSSSQSSSQASYIESHCLCTDDPEYTLWNCSYVQGGSTLWCNHQWVKKYGHIFSSVNLIFFIFCIYNSYPLKLSNFLFRGIWMVSQLSFFFILRSLSCYVGTGPRVP